MTALLSQQQRRSAHPIVLLDRDRRFVDVNQAACVMVERARVELVGRLVDELTPASRRDELRVRWRDFLAEGVAMGRWALERHGRELVHFDYFAMVAGVPDRLVVVAAHSRAGEQRAAGGRYGSRGQITDRERMVLSRLIRGQTGPEIATELGITVDTVRSHIRALKSKLEARTLSHLVAIAIRDGLVDEARLTARQI